jgi:hypothetical protein
MTSNQRKKLQGLKEEIVRYAKSWAGAIGIQSSAVAETSLLEAVKKLRDYEKKISK